MGVCSDERNKKNTLSNSDMNELSESFCQIIYFFDNVSFQTTGFFMTTEIDYSLKFLITSYYSISEKLLGKTIHIKIHNQKKTFDLLLDKNIRLISFLKDDLNIAMIQIKNEDISIDKNIKYLKYDEYNFNDFNYKNPLDVFTLKFVEEGNMNFNAGKIIKKKMKKNLNIIFRLIQFLLVVPYYTF